MRFLLAAALLPFPGAAMADCMAGLKAVYGMAAAVKSFRTEMLTEAGSGDGRVVGMFVLPGKFYSRSPAGEMIMIGSGVWLKESSGWTRLPPQFTPAAAAIMRTGFAAGLDGVRNVRCLDPVTIAKKRYDVYRFDNETAFMGVAGAEQVTLYVDPEAHLPVRQEVTSTAMGTRSTTVQAITYDHTVTIGMPRNELPAGEPGPEKPE